MGARAQGMKQAMRRANNEKARSRRPRPDLHFFVSLARPRLPAPPMTDGVGTYCATAGTVFTSKEALTAHYKSDFHR